MNMQNIKKRDVTYQFLLFEGNCKEDREEFNKRFLRLKEFLQYMKNEDTPLDGKVRVRVVRRTTFPSLSYYLLEKSGRETAIFYIRQMVKKDGKSLMAFQTYNESVVHSLDANFTEFWEKAEERPLQALLG